MSIAAYSKELAAQLAPSFLTDVRVRTAFSKESVILTGQNLAEKIRGVENQQPPSERVSRALYAVKPTVIIDSPVFGKKVFAPYGVATEQDYQANRRKLILASGLIVAGALGTVITLISAARS